MGFWEGSQEKNFDFNRVYVFLNFNLMVGNSNLAKTIEDCSHEYFELRLVLKKINFVNNAVHPVNNYPIIISNTKNINDIYIYIFLIYKRDTSILLIATKPSTKN